MRAIRAIATYFLQLVGGKHQHVSLWGKGLRRCKVTDALEMYARRGHNLDDMERCPAHIVA